VFASVWPLVWKWGRAPRDWVFSVGLAATCSEPVPFWDGLGGCEKSFLWESGLGWTATAGQLLNPRLSIEPRLGRAAGALTASESGTCFVAWAAVELPFGPVWDARFLTRSVRSTCGQPVLTLALSQRKVGPRLACSAQRTSLRRHRDEALQERGRGDYEQTDARSRARWHGGLVFFLSRSCVSVYRCLERVQGFFLATLFSSGQHSAISFWRSVFGGEFFGRVHASRRRLP
jgi:hypothetical protein